MRQFTQEGMFNELSKVTRAINKKKYEKMDLPKFTKGGPDEPSTTPVDEDKDYYTRMANSPLFLERYARMVGKPLEEVKDEAEAYRQQILNNIGTVKINDVGVFPKGVRRSDTEFIDGVYYAPLKKEDIDRAYQHANDLPRLFRKGFLRRINKEIQNYPDHQLFLYQDDPWVKTHELSHGSVKGQMENMNVNEYNFKDMSDELPRTRRYYDGREEYLTDPNEQKARVDVARKYLESKGLYDPVNEPFTEKHYKLLQDEITKKLMKIGENQGFKTGYDPNLPNDIEEIVNPYEEKTVIDMFNNFVSNDKKQDLQQGRLGGLAKFIDGGEPEYTFDGRPDSRYKKVNGQWHIKNSSTNNAFVPINDPTGKRTNLLNAQAKLVANDRPQLAPFNNALLTNGKTPEQFYIEQNQYSPELAKQSLVNKYKAEEAARLAELKRKQEEERYLASIPKGLVSDNTRTVIPDIAVQAINNKPAVDAAIENQKKEQAKFESESWDDYEKRSLGEKALDRTKAFMVDPFGMTSRFLMGEQAYFPGMGEGLLNHDSEYYDNYLKALGYTPGEFEAYDLGTFINPMHWGASAGNQLRKGNYGQGTLETALAIAPFLPKGMASASNIKYGAKLLADDMSRLYNKIEPVTSRIGEGAYWFGKNVKESLTPGMISKYQNKIDDLSKARLESHQEYLKKYDDVANLEGDIMTTEYQLKRLKGVRESDTKAFLELKALEKKLEDLKAIKEKVQINDGNLYYENLNSTYENLGTMKTKAFDDVTQKEVDYIYDFQTGEKVPFGITAPKQKVSIELENGVPVKKIKTEDDFAFDQNFAATQQKNIEFVKEKLPGSKPFGSATFHNLGVAHATNDIDVAMTASDWDKIKDTVKLSNGKQAKYGPTISLGDEFGSQGNIDINIIKENSTTGMAEGDFAKELYRQFFPEDFYKQTQEIVNQKIGNPKLNASELPEIKINKTAKELLDAYDSEVKSILDAYEATPNTRDFYLPTKAKQINRIDYILETGTNYDKIEKAQELYARSIAGNNASTGYKFSANQLSDFGKNYNLLYDMGYDVNTHNLAKIAADPKRMQLFLNDFYINNSIYTRQITLLPEYIKTPDDLINAFTEWKAKGASLMGLGTNSVKLGDPKFATRLDDVTGNIYYNLMKNKTYNTPKEYVDDIIRQTSGNREFSEIEINNLKEIAKKHNLELNETALPKTLGDLLDSYRYSSLNNDGMKLSKTFDEADVKNINNFYVDVAKELGAKSVQRGFFGNSVYTTLLNDFDKEFDALTLSLNKYVPTLKSQTERLNNLKDFTTSKNLQISEQDYYKLKGYLEGGYEALVEKKKEAEKFYNMFNSQIKDRAKNIVARRDKVAYETLVKQRDELLEKTKEIQKTLEEVVRRKHKIKDLRPAVLIGALSTATGYSLHELSKQSRKDRLEKYIFELDLINDYESRTGSLSEEQERRRNMIERRISDEYN